MRIVRTLSLRENSIMFDSSS